MRKEFKNCQKFTPQENVRFTLDLIQFNENIYGTSILENSCGDGNFLIEIVDRYIKDGIRLGISKEEIRQCLETNIYAVEIDLEHYAVCNFKLWSIAARYGLGCVKWNLLLDDSLRITFPITFDYVIGNPPYIIYRNLPTSERRYIKDNFITCNRGQFDYCYAFIESGVNWLADGGTLAYIIPSSIFKNTFAHDLREFILPYLKKIYDYGNERQFQDALTSSSIIILKKGEDLPNFEYAERTNETRIINKNLIQRDKWRFNDFDIFEVLQNYEHRFGDYFKVANSIATLSNKIFIIRNFNDIDDHYLYGDGFQIERGALKRAFSPKSIANDRDEWIIFPYFYNNGQLNTYEEDRYRELYPHAYDYLVGNRETLLSRDADSNAKWFEYGRSQALNHLYRRKLLISRVFTNHIRPQILNEDDIPYSGAFILEKANHHFTLDDAIAILQSGEFTEYMLSIGIPSAGNSVRFSVKDVENYRFNI